jgi:hypothetical protein
VSDIQQIRADLGIPAEHKSSPLKNWYIDHFKKYLSTIRSSELLTTYFAASYGELYEYGSDFIRVLHLIDETADQKTIRADVRRLGWKWYRVATDADSNVRRDDNGEWVRMTEEEVDYTTTGFSKTDADSRAARADYIVEITTGRLGEIIETGKDMGQVLPCYLFHVRYPWDLRYRSECNNDFWTAQDFLEALNGRSGEDAVYWICHQLLPVGGRVKTLLNQTEKVLEKPDLLRTDIDQRRKTRSVDLGSVNSDSTVTSVRLVATSECLIFLKETPGNV